MGIRPVGPGRRDYHLIGNMRCLRPSLHKVRRSIGTLLLSLAIGGLAVGPVSSETLLVTAKLLIEDGKFAEAQGILQTMLSEGPNPRPEVRYQLAVCHARLGKRDMAEQNLDIVLRTSPDHLPSLHLKSYLLFSSGQYHEALAWAARYLERQPDGGETRKIAGLARFMLGDKAGAEHDLKRTAELSPRDFDAHYYLGRIYFERSKLTLALEEFRKAITLNPRSVKARNHLGQTLEGLTRFDEAMSAYSEAIEFEREGHERSEWPYYNLGSLVLTEGEAARAVELLEQALERNSSSVQTRTKLGVALSAASRLQDAERELRTALRTDPDNADAHFQLGRVLMKLGQTVEGRRHLARFERLREP